MYFDCHPLSKYLSTLENYRYIDFFLIKGCFLSFPHTLLHFFGNKNYSGGGFSG